MNIRTYLLIPALALSLCTARAQKLAGGDISMLPRYEQAGATYSTGISQLSVNTSKTTDDRYYDLSGHSVSQPKDNGVYIHHQKKIIVR